MSVKQIRDLCARDIDRPVRVELGRGEAREGALVWVVSERRDPRSKFLALTGIHDHYEIRVGGESLSGLPSTHEVIFLDGGR